MCRIHAQRIGAHAEVAQNLQGALETAETARFALLGGQQLGLRMGLQLQRPAAGQADDFRALDGTGVYQHAGGGEFDQIGHDTLRFND
ncbi:hypothetical protein RLIN73S_00400 [Rhodanobacter lindaniclasticus]